MASARRLFLCFLGTLFLCTCKYSLVESRKVVVKLKAPWQTTSLSPIIETSEYLADESSKSFWTFVGSYRQYNTSLLSSKTLSSETVYVANKKAAIEVAKTSTDMQEIQAKILELILDTRAYAPSVEAYLQVASSFSNFCGNASRPAHALAVLGESGKVLCTLQELQEAVTAKDSKNKSSDGNLKTVSLLPFDHIYPTLHSPPSVEELVASIAQNTQDQVSQPPQIVLLYGVLGSETFHSFHQYLSKEASSGSLHYIFRHLPLSSELPTVLQGYGISLDIKNLEYKNLDDSVAKEENEAEEMREAEAEDESDDNEEDDLEEDVHGFLFEKLKRRLALSSVDGSSEEDKATIVKKVQKLKKALLDRVAAQEQEKLGENGEGKEDSAEKDKLKAWDLTELGLAAASVIAESGDPLRKLEQISQNFPLYGKSLSQRKLSPTSPFVQEIKEESTKIAQALSRQTGSLFVNGIPISGLSTTSFNAYALLKTIRREADYVQMIQQIPDVDEDQRAKILSSAITASSSATDNENEADELRIDIISSSPSNILYLNNVETDASYSGLPEDLNYFFMPTYGLRVVRKNLYTVVVLLDPTTAKTKDIIQTFQMFQQRRLPFRVGVLLSCPSSSKEEKPKGADVSEDQSGLGGKAIECSDYLRVFAYVKDVWGDEAAVSFFTSLAQSQDDVPTLETIESLLTSVASSHGAEDLKKRREEGKISSSSALPLLFSLIKDEENIKRAGKLQNFVSSRNLPLNSFLFNGKLVRNLDLESQILSLLSTEQGVIAKLIQQGKLKQSSSCDFHKVILKSFNAVKRFHPYLQEKAEEKSVVSLSGSQNRAWLTSLTHLHAVKRQSNESEPEEEQSATHELFPFTFHVFADLSTERGRKQVTEAVDLLISLNGEGEGGDKKKNKKKKNDIGHSSTRLSIIYNPSQIAKAKEEASASTGEFLSFLFKRLSSSDFKPKSQDSVLKFYRQALSLASEALSLSQLTEQLISKAKAAENSPPVLSSDNISFLKKWGQGTTTEKSSDSESQFGPYATAVSPGESVVFLNGRKIQSPLKAEAKVSAVVSAGDLDAILDFEKKTLAEKVFEATSSSGMLTQEPSSTSSSSSDLFLSVYNIFSLMSKVERIDPIPTESLSTLKHLKKTFGSPDQLQVVAILDPLSQEAQRISSVLKVLRDQLPIYLSLYLVPSTVGYSELPLKRFFRFVWHSHPLSPSSPSASFSRLPLKPILTTKIETPEPWNVQTALAEQDLDNLRIEDKAASSSSASFVYAEYFLKNMLVTGHCEDKTRQWLPPPNGLQLVLRRQREKNRETTQQKPTEGLELKNVTRDMGETVDTLVMQNLGYFQLQANPGIWRLSLARGRASKVYEILSSSALSASPSLLASTSSSTAPSPQGILVVVKDFFGEPIRLLVRKRKGMEEVPLLDKDAIYAEARAQKKDNDAVAEDEKSLTEASEVKENPSIWSKMMGLMGFTGEEDRQLSTFGGASSDDETIHVFSLATGHLYERFLKIMMLSVSSHSSLPVKFWLLENFLSPGFKRSLAALSKEFGFSYSLITYKWPHWLRQQEEKQRIIWGYKILFLDVLFPLHIKKIIYVDADQVLRADIRELWDMDLQGAAYAYTPFCSSREETLGYQFWREGYWAGHLRGRPYHISALYVVDLVEFRMSVAGDQLRAIYHELSADKSSLSNLDQDLPNFAQHQIPIFSLPQEWLWCESWCSDESKKDAKTIDLCNNPLHKEPKLAMAKRVVSGELFDKSWVELDEMVKAVEEKDKAGAHEKLASESTKDEKASGPETPKKETDKKEEL